MLEFKQSIRKTVILKVFRSSVFQMIGKILLQLLIRMNLQLNALTFQGSGPVLHLGRCSKSRLAALRNTSTIVFQLGTSQLRRMLIFVALLMDGSFSTEAGLKILLPVLKK